MNECKSRVTIYGRENEPDYRHAYIHIHINRRHTHTCMHLFFPRKLVNMHELMYASTYENIQAQRKIEAPESTQTHKLHGNKCKTKMKKS